MRSRAWSLAISLALLVAPAVGLAQPLADGADSHFHAGNEAYDRGDFGAAADAYAAAFAIKPTHDIAANLAATEAKLGRLAAAANHYAYALAHFPPTGDAAKRAGLSKRYDDVRSQVGTVSLQVEDGASILVDGVVTAAAPLPGGAFHVAPGERTVEARRGDRQGRATVQVAAGETRTLELPLTSNGSPPDEVASPPPPPSSPPDAAADDGLPLWPVAVGGGASALALGVGIGFLLAGSSAGDDAEALRAELAGTSCASSSDPRCSALADAASDESTFGAAGVGLLVGGGVLAVGSVVYALVAGGSGERGTAVVPLVGPGVAGAAARGSF